jgi:cold shock CspA family protein
VSVERIAVYARGTMTRWLESKKFGFATIDDAHDTDVFVHLNDIVAKKWLKQGDKIGFFIAATREGQRPRALSVRRLEPRNALKEFADIEKFERGPLLTQLATMAQEEDWSYKNDQSGRQHPILYSYIRYTFARLLNKGKISETKNNEGGLIACFHTGLVTPAQEEIYGYFTERRGMPRWNLSDFLKVSDRKLKFFAPLPDMAHYFDDPLHLLYDTRRELRPVYDHIYERLSRFPESFQKSAHKDLILKGAIDAAIKRVRRNYKTAIPHFYNGRLQLLLPLCLESPEHADLALVVDRDEHGVYFADTVLTLDMAYNDARLIVGRIVSG